jgi:hypothetical protein
MSHEFVRGREAAFVTSGPVARKVSSSTDVVGFDVVVELFGVQEFVPAGETLPGPMTAVLAVDECRSTCETWPAHGLSASRRLYFGDGTVLRRLLDVLHLLHLRELLLRKSVHRGKSHVALILGIAVGCWAER